MRRLATALCLVFLFAAAFSPAAAPRGISLTMGELTLLDAINSVRVASGLSPLALDPRLERAARAHSQDMLQHGYFGHGDFASRLQHFGARGPVLGENLAWHTGRLGAASTVSEWLASPPHRENLLRPGFRRVGLATPVGRYVNGWRATLITADFAGH